MRRLFSALAFLTVIPIPERLKSSDPQTMFAAFPVGGLLIGVVLACVAEACALVLPPMLVAVALIAAGIFLTGGIHLDGLADCADAFYGRRDRAKVLEILKDPRIGTMGGAAIGLSLITRFASFATLPVAFLVAGLPFASVLSRTASIVCLRLLPYVRSQGGILAAGSSVSWKLTTAAGLVLVLVAVLLPIPAVASFAALAILWLVSWRKLGGCTGDVLGASIELAEVVFLAAFAAEVSHGSVIGLLQFLTRAVAAGGDLDLS